MDFTDKKQDETMREYIARKKKKGIGDKIAIAFFTLSALYILGHFIAWLVR